MSYGEEWVDPSFYAKGAHEKGFIGWEQSSDKDGNPIAKGVFIQHSLPKFPNTKKDGIEFKIVQPHTWPTIGNEMIIPYLGWGPNGFFTPNLLSRIIDRDYKGNDHVEKNEDGDYPTKEEANDGEFLKLEGRSYVNIINNKGINIRGTIFSNRYKPAQHIFCASLDGQNNIKDLLELLGNLGEEGIKTNAFDKKIGDAIKELKATNVGRFNGLAFSDSRKSDDGGQFTIEELKNLDGLDKKKLTTYEASIISKTIETSNQKYFMRVPSSKNNKNDIWKSLVLSKENPRLEKEEMKNMRISTWVTASTSVNRWDISILENKNIFFQANVKLNQKKESVTWKSNTNKEHSKIGFKLIEKVGSLWNVCFSGGNLYLDDRKDPIKSSLLMCFKNDPLNTALKGLMVDKEIENPLKETTEKFEANTREIMKLNQEFKTVELEEYITYQNVLNLSKQKKNQKDQDKSTQKYLANTSLKIKNAVVFKMYPWDETLEEKHFSFKIPSYSKKTDSIKIPTFQAEEKKKRLW